MIAIRSPHRAARRRRGSLLVWTAFISMAILATTMISATVARSSSQLANSQADRVVAERLAEASAEQAATEIRAALLDDANPPDGGTLELATGSATYTIAPIGNATTAADDSGLIGLDQLYRIEAFGTGPRGSVARVRRLVVGRQVPMFQYAVAHDDDLIFWNPAPLEINGPVHTNGNLYIHSRRDLVFNTNVVRAAGEVRLSAPYEEWYGYWKDWWHSEAVDPQFRRWVADPSDGSEPEEYVSLAMRDTMTGLGIATESGMDSAFVDGHDSNSDGDFDDLGDYAPFAVAVLEDLAPPTDYAAGHGATLQSVEHGDHTVLMPTPESFEMYVEGADLVWDDTLGEYVAAGMGQGTHSLGKWFSQADLSIISHPDGTWTAYDGGGNDVSADVSAAVTSSSLYDARQAEGSGESIQNTVLDLAALGATGRFPINGLLYVAGEGAGEGTDVKGFQLSNGSELPGPLTVVSPDSVYIHGDYNTVNKQPASVMADAVNLLSNAWDGTKAAGELPDASDTTYNVALVLGDSEPGPNYENGGAVNLARYHEYWTGFTAAIHGSIICNGYSRKATGAFVLGGDYYHAPTRAWTFDENFMSPAALPPFTPSFVSVTDAAVW